MASCTSLSLLSAAPSDIVTMIWPSTIAPGVSSLPWGPWRWGTLWFVPVFRHLKSSGNQIPSERRRFRPMTSAATMINTTMIPTAVMMLVTLPGPGWSGLPRVRAKVKDQIKGHPGCPHCPGTNHSRWIQNKQYCHHCYNDIFVDSNSNNCNQDVFIVGCCQHGTKVYKSFLVDRDTYYQRHILGSLSGHGLGRPRLLTMTLHHQYCQSTWNHQRNSHGCQCGDMSLI